MNTTLSNRQQAIVPIAAFAASGHMPGLKMALHDGLGSGLTVNEIKEILVQLYAYAGFPRSLNALGAFQQVLGEREAKGIRDEPGKEASPVPAGTTSLERGTKVQTTLAGAPVKGGLMDFAPAIDEFLKAHLFGDIFGRDNLDWQSREIATVSALASMDGVESQLRAHCRISRNVGLTAKQMQDLAAVLRAKVAESTGKKVDVILEEEDNRQP
ncbi:MAG: carboxymuconolactone decarboxylase family protein [Desulfovibrio sp.]|uniref:carboxymuconolactone decarboxylase family protein n=1 Tax=Desulfovibrio sp. TaxID=885 RepID=UPI0039E6DEB1